MLFFLSLPFFLLSKSCSELDPWLLNCSMPSANDTYPYTIYCPKSGKFEISCVPLVECEKTEDTVTRTIACHPTDGKDPGTALCLSIILGFLGADRFYLGYPTIGLFKLLTGGFFGLGWYIDVFLIALRIVQPARGGVYMFKQGANFIVRLPGPDYL